MANTWTVLAAGITHAASAKCYLQIAATASNTQTIKIRRIWLLNAQTAAVTGVLGTLSVGSYSTAWTTGTVAQTAIAHDTNNTALDAKITINSGGTSAGVLVQAFRTFPFASDEPAAGTFKYENFLSTPSTAIVWDAGYGDANIDPLTIPASTAGVIAVHGTMSAVGNIDVAIEFTTE